jgi:putative solute:sodium symporter small subunit
METTPPPEAPHGKVQPPAASYWSRNLARLALLLSIWFFGSFGVSILLVDKLDQFSFFGFPLGFWFAQQGSIFIFLALIITYVVTMNALDDEYPAERKAPSELGEEESKK